MSRLPAGVESGGRSAERGASGAPRSTLPPPRPGPVRCSVVIPVYNQAALSRQCLDALLADPPRVGHEVIVVDDASTDATADLLADYGGRVRVVTHAANAGFGRSCNDGAAAARGEYLVFLNNDTEPRPDWLDALCAAADAAPRAGVLGCKLLYPDGTVQHAGVVFHPDGTPRHLYAGFPADHPAVNVPRRFQAVTGACLLVRRALFEELDGFDTRFVNGYEDVDLCLRAGERGHEVLYRPEAVVVHYESVTRSGRRVEDQRNHRRHLDRWAGRVRADEFDYYVADGLLAVDRRATYPLTLTVDPALAVVDQAGRRSAADELIRARTAQVHGLLQENIRLALSVLSAEKKVLSRKPTLGTQHAARSTDDDPQAFLARAYHDALRQNGLDPAEVGDDLADRFVCYQASIARVRAAVRAALPAGMTVLVVSKGDDELLRLDGRTGWHFPRTDTGVYAGHHPADGRAAIDHLEALRATGADALVLPATAFWWLEHYADFRRHLDERYERIWADADCVIYRLTGAGSGAGHAQ
jgi:GT2 family glycosyltransferase